MTAFSARVDAFFVEYFRLHPLEATAAGMHAHDGTWPDLSEAGREARLEFADRWEAELAAVAPATLDPDEALDRDLLLGELATERFSETELREETWDALAYVALLGAGLFPLLARDFAPLASRLTSAASRIEGIPAIAAEARRLLGSGARPASRLHVEKALRQMDGVTELVDEAVSTAEGAHESDPDVAKLLPRLKAAREQARRAVDELRAHLETVVLPAARGEGRLGRDLFARKLRHTLKSDLTPEAVADRANQEYVAVRAELVRLARDAWPAWVPDRPLPTAETAGSADAAEAETVRTVLTAVGKAHPQPSDLLDYCRAELARIEAFCRATDLVGLSDEPLQVTWTPVFMRAYGGAFLDSPGPLDEGQRSFFWVTPTPDDWTPEQVESYLSEDNDRMLRLLSIHEGVPGHYLQGVYARRCPSLARAVFWSGVYAEGWAVYVTQVMMDAGYGADDPALLLTHWKFYLRAVTNALVDVGVHAGTMTEDEAIELMVDGGFQEEAEARAKWDRARLTSTQLSTYFVGSMAMWDLERARRERLAVASGDPRGAGAVPAPHVVGGFGETPGFRYREHLEAVLAPAALPMPLLSRAVLGD